MKDVLGIIFADDHNARIPELTSIRPLGAIPVAGRYRSIDFILSNMVNSGIINVAVVTQNNYHSLMDHLGSGKQWNLSRKKYGLMLFPPYANSEGLATDSRIDFLYGLLSFLRISTQKYVLLSESNLIMNTKFDEAFEYHISSGADLTIIYEESNKTNPNLNESYIYTDKEENVVDIEINANYNGSTKKCLGMYIIDRQALISIIENAHSRGKKGYLMNLVLRNIGKLKIKGYKSKSFIRKINTINDYYRLNMEILNKNVRDILFNTNSRIYTKVKDMTPTKYLENSKVKNSFIADGCIIDGEVENSIIFRGVVINRGSVIKNSIIMQQSEIQNNTHLENVILDKRVLIRENKTLIGTEDFPIVVSKGKVI